MNEVGGPSGAYPNRPLSNSKIIDSIDLPWKNEAANKDFLIQKYIVEGLSMNQIAVLIGASKLTVWHALKDFGIPTRSKSQGQKKGRKSQMRYGYRRVNGAETPHLGEQRMIGVVQDLNQQGLSLRRIA